jgi:hypothetical protein
LAGLGHVLAGDQFANRQEDEPVTVTELEFGVSSHNPYQGNENASMSVINSEFILWPLKTLRGDVTIKQARVTRSVAAASSETVTWALFEYDPTLDNFTQVVDSKFSLTFTSGNGYAYSTRDFSLTANTQYFIGWIGTNNDANFRMEGVRVNNSFGPSYYYYDTAIFTTKKRSELTQKDLEFLNVDIPVVQFYTEFGKKVIGDEDE